MRPHQRGLANVPRQPGRTTGALSLEAQASCLELVSHRPVFQRHECVVPAGSLLPTGTLRPMWGDEG